LTTLLLILSLCLSLATAWLFWQLKLQKALIEEVHRESHGPDDTREPEPILTLSVQDPIAVAKRESRSARVLADRLPVMVTKLVYQEVMKELQKEMEERDIAVVLQLEYR
jgi:hypothetical protein